jgi:hypothetical protein
VIYDQGVTARHIEASQGTIMPKPDLMGLLVRDMAKTLRFYRWLRMDIPASADQTGHMEVKLPGGFRIAWDTFEELQSFAPEYQLLNRGCVDE